MHNRISPFNNRINYREFMRGGKREGAGRKAGITHKGMETRTISIRVEKSKYQELKDICIEAIKEKIKKL